MTENVIIYSMCYKIPLPCKMIPWMWVSCKSLYIYERIFFFGQEDCEYFY